MASSSSSYMRQKHQVFMSFRGEDTRNNFTSHLHAALNRKGIAYFIDYQLKRGEEISPALLTAIEESMVSIIVLSENYASSTWCLDELCKILECKKRNGQMVIPIFYHVNPSDVRKQTGSFAEAFTEHIEKRTDKVEKWRAAMKEVGNLSGWHLPGQPNERCESKFIEDIVEEISKKLIYSNELKGRLVGIGPRIEQIESLLCFNLVDIRILGIWGMGGIGKTTIAEAIYYRISNGFEGRYILTNVKEKSQKYGWIHLRDELLRNILEETNLTIGTGLLPTFVYDRLCHKRVFIVLDDVDDSIQLDLSFAKHCFGPGSRIVVTSRDKQVLQRIVDKIYEVQELNTDEALQLFCLYAFQQNHPQQDFVELSKEVVHYAKGVPLPLKVVGSDLYGRSKLDWEAYLNKLKKISDPKIDDILRISYDGLNHVEKNIFLDIACFFKGNYRDYVENILDDCYYNSVKFGISVLIDKSLITISHNILLMHDLIQKMGWNIILQESKEPGKRSRLWTPKDINHVLKNDTGTEMVEGMFLDMSKIGPVEIKSSTTFARMCNLKLLKFYYGDFRWKGEMKVYLSQGDLESLPDCLHLLHWDTYPSKSLPSNFCPNNLVELCMPNNHIEKLWNGVQDLLKLKRLDLSGSRHLIEIPDLSRATALERIDLRYCESLVEVPSSIGCLSKLKYLDMDRCRMIEELPSSIEHLVGLEELYLNHCEKLKNLPSGISKLKSLETLDLFDCLNITKFPETPGNLGKLNLSGTAIEQVPSSIECLSQLEEFRLGNCAKLSNLPRNIFQSKSLFQLRVYGFSKLEVIQECLGTVQVLIANGTAEISINKSRKELYVSSCSGFVELLDDIDDLENLKLFRLDLNDCNLLAFPNRFTCLSSLTSLSLRGNSFETIPASIGQLLNLEYLNLSHCKSLQSLPASIKQLLNLKELILSHCERLQLLPELPPHLCLYASDCTSLEAVSSSFTICPMSTDHQHQNQSLRYEFMNCINLDQNTIWPKTQLGIQQLATEDVKLYHTAPKKQYPDTSFKQYPDTSCSIFLPGSEIPEWFIFQNEGSSVTIQLPPYFHHHEFVGFAVCTVLAFNNSFEGFFLLDCQYNFKTYRDYFHGFSNYLAQENFNSPDHVWVNYNFDLYRHSYEEIGYHPNAASFTFSVHSDFVVIKKCGVRLLYAQDDLTDFPHRPIEECNPLMIQPNSPYDPIVEESTTTKRLHDDYYNDEVERAGNLSSDKEQEPHPKRLKL